MGVSVGLPLELPPGGGADQEVHEEEDAHGDAQPAEGDAGA